MALMEIEHLIVGGGGAGTAAAATLRLEDADCSIAILSAEAGAPYYRPAVSKQFLQGGLEEDHLLLNPEHFYRDRAIQLITGTGALAVDSAARIVTDTSGRRFHYKHLLIAPGARAERLTLPGADLPGVWYLRDRQECIRVREEIAAGARHAVVLGGSFLGMEIAMTLLGLGLDVTLVEQLDHILPHVESRRVSAYFQHYAEERGARFLLGDTLAAIHGDGQAGGGRVTAVETRSGERLPCDLLMVSIGIVPATDFLAGSGIALDHDGLVLVDEQLRTNVPGIFAAGDAVSFHDPVFARRRHIAHWDNAVKQGRLAARNMLGRRLRYDEVSCFFCDIGDISFSMLGAPEDGDEKIVRGSVAEKSLAIFYLKDGVVRALLSSGRPAEETRSAEGLIRYRVNLGAAKARLSDPAFALETIPTQTVLVLQGGGALGAFECGVVKALEEEHIYPDIVAGISIGALNGAIIAGNPRDATRALESFWSELSVEMPGWMMGLDWLNGAWVGPSGMGEEAARALTSARILSFGVPNFFRPRWMDALNWPEGWNGAGNWTSFYDVSPMKAMLARYVDFAKLKASPVRLLVGAVNVETAELEVFDSYVDDLTPDHILASGSLPPGFSWTQIGDEAYWDGGLVSNSPLDMVADRCGAEGKCIYIVDLFAGRRTRPHSLMEAMARRDEIVYSERVRSDLRLREVSAAYRGLIHHILNKVDPAAQARIRQRPQYIELMKDGALTNIVRFVRQGEEGEPSSRDYDFSGIAIRTNQQQGYALVKQTLAEAAKRSG